MIYLLLVHPDEVTALAWVTIEPSPVGGFTLWPEPFVGQYHPPVWRGSATAAKEEALSMCTEWSTQAPYEGGYLVQVVTPDEVVVEEITL